MSVTIRDLNTKVGDLEAERDHLEGALTDLQIRNEELEAAVDHAEERVRSIEAANRRLDEEATRLGEIATQRDPSSISSATPTAASGSTCASGQSSVEHARLSLTRSRTAFHGCPLAARCSSTARPVKWYWTTSAARCAWVGPRWLKICGSSETSTLQPSSMKRGRFTLSRRFYAFLGKKGEYTRRVGLDREQNKALLLKHIRDNPDEGCRMDELMQVLPALSRNQVRSLLRNLRDEGLVRTAGRTSAARWHPVV